MNKGDKVTNKNYKDYLEVVSHIGNNYYLLYSPSLRHSVVLEVKELKKIK